MEDKRGEDGDLLSEQDPRELYPVKEEEKVNIEVTRDRLCEWFPIWTTTIHPDSYTLIATYISGGGHEEQERRPDPPIQNNDIHIYILFLFKFNV